MSFRSKVHDALNIVKGSVKLPIDEVLLGKQYVESKSKDFDAAVCIANTPAQYDIGGGHCQTLDHLTFVMGKPILPITLAAVQNAGSMSDGPASTQKPYPSNSIIENGAAVETGAHYLGGLYDESNNKLRSIRKAAINPVTYESGAQYKDWPSGELEQNQLLMSDPYADSLIYHQTKLSFLITGIQRPDFERSSNQRGLVRMLIVRPIIPTARLHMNGVTGKPTIRTDYLPNIETELFYSGKRMLGGRLDPGRAHDANDSNNCVTFGLDKMDKELPTMNLDTDSIYYGKLAPCYTSDAHRLSPFDLITSPVNRKKYKVIADKSFHLDTQHHGVASMRTEHVTIPYHMQARFAGRVPANDNDRTLSDTTFNEPLNMPSKPIIMFLSLDQKLSVQPTGYTVISES
tara:strand:+ start:724 stop:1932 length:1209 start_codon:yes stop_codon:yes gene_type:complete